jgi:hypothetical protein
MPSLTRLQKQSATLLNVGNPNQSCRSGGFARPARISKPARLIPLRFFLHVDTQKTVDPFSTDVRTWNGSFDGPFTAQSRPDLRYDKNHIPELGPRPGQKFLPFGEQGPSWTWDGKAGRWMASDTVSVEGRDMIRAAAEAAAKTATVSRSPPSSPPPEQITQGEPRADGLVAAATPGCGPEVICLKFHENFKAIEALNYDIVERVLHEVKETCSCLWVALHDAIADAKIENISAELDDPSQIKQQCLAYMRIDDKKQRAGDRTEEHKRKITEEQKKATFKVEFQQTKFTLATGNTVGVADFYQVCF